MYLANKLGFFDPSLINCVMIFVVTYLYKVTSQSIKSGVVYVISCQVKKFPVGVRKIRNACYDELFVVLALINFRDDLTSTPLATQTAY